MVYIGTNEYKHGRMIMSHMVADTLPELFDMADNLGISRNYYQDISKTRGKPHFDVCRSKKKRALLMGAKEVNDKELINVFHSDYYRDYIQKHV